MEKYIPYLLERQSEEVETAVRELAQKFKKSQKVVLEELQQIEDDTYDIFLDVEVENATGNTIVSAYPKIEEIEDAPTAEPDQEDEDEDEDEDDDSEDIEPLTVEELKEIAKQRKELFPHLGEGESINWAAELDQVKTLPSIQKMAEVLSKAEAKKAEAGEKPVKSTKPRTVPEPKEYRSFTEAEADELFPDRISMGEMGKICKEQGIPTSNLVRAFGGDRMRFEPLNEHWHPFVINNGRRRWLPGSAIERLDDLRQISEKSPVETKHEAKMSSPDGLVE